MAKQKEIAISVKDLHKSFKLPHEQHSGLKQAILGVLRRNRKKGYEVQQVLKGLDFEIEKGDFFGIVGRNGSGKSTLLKTLAGIYAPDKGAVQINGTLVPFIELGVGFNPELTGRENVFLNGALLGFSREEMEAMYEDIVEFAELEKFMDQKLKNYSSGMQVRLAFSIAIRADADILLLDEILAVGDEAFQRKCYTYFKQLKKNKKTVILVTHDMDSVRKYCTKAIFIKEGKVAACGVPEDVANEYTVENLGAQVDDNQDRVINDQIEPIISNFKAQLLSPRNINQNGEIKIKVSYKTSRHIDTYPVCDLRDIDRNAPLVTAGAKLTDKRLVECTWSIKVPNINNTNMIANFVVRDKNNEMLYYLPDNASPKVSLQRNDYPNPRRPTTYALLFDKGEWV